VKVRSFLKAVDHERIVAAIRDAEARSTAEVRVHVSNEPVEDAQKAAAAQFEKLGMTATRDRNGVLVFIAPAAQKFAIVGDAGIDARCGPDFWQEAAAAMGDDFHAGRFTDGIVKTVARVGEALAAYFPCAGGRKDVNELPDEVSEE